MIISFAYFCVDIIKIDLANNQLKESDIYRSVFVYHLYEAENDIFCRCYHSDGWMEEIKILPVNFVIELFYFEKQNTTTEEVRNKDCDHN